MTTGINSHKVKRSYEYDYKYQLFCALQIIDNDALSDTYVAIQCLKDCIKVQGIPLRCPNIVFKHQIYRLISDKTLVDRQLVSNNTLEHSSIAKYYDCKDG